MLYFIWQLPNPGIEGLDNITARHYVDGGFMFPFELVEADLRNARAVIKYEKCLKFAKTTS